MVVLVYMWFPDFLLVTLFPRSLLSFFLSDLGYPLCKNKSTELYCSASHFCEEELSMLELGLLVMLGIPSFNAAADVNLLERFYHRGSLGEECVPILVRALMEVTKIARGELIGASRLLRTCRHRIVLAPLRLGVGIGREHVELQLLAQLGYLLNTVMIDANSTSLKQIVQKLRFKLMSIKSLLKMFKNIDTLERETKQHVKQSLLYSNQGLGTFDQAKGDQEKKKKKKK